MQMYAAIVQFVEFEQIRLKIKKFEKIQPINFVVKERLTNLITKYLQRQKYTRFLSLN